MDPAGGGRNDSGDVAMMDAYGTPRPADVHVSNTTATAQQQQQIPIGTAVSKEFPPFGFYTGSVVSYDAPYYRVEYSDGDKEDLEHDQVLPLLAQVQAAVAVAPSATSKKRPRPDDADASTTPSTTATTPSPSPQLPNNSTAVAVVDHHRRRTRPAPTGTCTQARIVSRDNNADANDVFSETIARHVAAHDQVDDSGGSSSSSSSRTELRELALLCVRQSDALGFHTIRAAAHGDENDECPGLGLVVQNQLAPLVQRAVRTHVLPAAVQVLQQNNSNGGGGSAVWNQWLSTTASPMLDALLMGLEAAGIIVFIASVEGIDRRVVSDDALDACLSLYKEHTKTLVPVLNQTMPLASSASTAAVLGLSPTKKRRRSSKGGDNTTAVTAKTGGGGNNATATLKKLQKLYQCLHGTLQLQLILMERLETLIHKITLDDQHILLLTHGALQTLQVLDTPPIVTAAIRLATAAFGRYPPHRDAIRNDLFPLMLQLPTAKKYRKSCTVTLRGAPPPLAARVLQATDHLQPHQQQHSSNSKLGIQMFTSLILSLVQSCVVTPCWTENQEFQSGLFRAHQWVHNLLVHWVTRCLKTKNSNTSSSSVAEYRLLLHNFVQDLLTVLLVPQYPSAQLVLTTLVQQLHRVITASTASGKKSSSTVSDPTFLTVAFDILGKITAVEARTLAMNEAKPIEIFHNNRHPNNDDEPSSSTSPSSVKVQCYCGSSRTDLYTIACDHCGNGSHGHCVGVDEDSHVDEWLCDACRLGIVGRREARKLMLLPLSVPTVGNTVDDDDGAAASDDTTGLDREFILQHSYLSALSQYLGVTDLQDSMDFHLARWVEQIEVGVTTSKGKMSDQQQQRQRRIAQELVANHWGKESFGLCANSLTDEGATRVLVSLIASSPLVLSFRHQISFILKMMADNSTSMLRKLALKAIEKTAEGDHKVMLRPVITKAVSLRLSDDSISVREAAVALVGSYVVKFPPVANALHSSLEACLTDVGVSVRKRAVRIFQEILMHNPGYRGRASVSQRMLERAVDPKEEDGVRDLIYDLFGNLWLSDVVFCEKTPSPLTHQSSSAAVPGSPLLSKGLTSVVTPSTPSLLQTPPMQPKRSDIAAAQMMEVVRSCKSGDDLEYLLKKLLTAESDTETSKSAERRKKAALNQKYCTSLVDSLFKLLITTEEGKSNKRRTGKDLAAILQTIAVFSRISTAAVMKHFDTILPYFLADNAERPEDEAAIVGAVCEIVARLSPNLNEEDLLQLESGSLAKSLGKIIYRFGSSTLSAAVDALSSLAHHPESGPESKFKKKLLELSKTFYNYLFSKKSIEDFSSPEAKKIRSNSHRALTVLGHVCRNHERSITCDEHEGTDDIPPSDFNLENTIQACFSLFLGFLQKIDAPTKCKALRGLAGIFMTQPRLMLELQQNGLIDSVMAEEAHSTVQLEALQCWKEILLAEERRIDGGHATEKLENDKDITLSDRISGDRDGDATLFGGVLTSHSERLFELSQARDNKIRFAALDLIGQLLRQGLLNPNETIPYLLALQGDVENEAVRTLALKLLLAERERRPDLLRQRICPGVKRAYLFQRKSYPAREQISAIVSTKEGRASDVECVFSIVFKQGVASNKKQRHGLFKNLLTFFELPDIDPAESTSKSKRKKSKDIQEVNLSLLSFVTQILAHLPYITTTDPLFIIHEISSLVTLQGGEIVDKLALLLRPVGLANGDELDEANAGEDALESAAKSKFPSRTSEAASLSKEGFDMKQFAELCRRGTTLTLLLRLKAHLRKMYNLSDARCLEYDPNAKERVGEKGVSKNEFAGTFEGRVSSSNEIDTLVGQYAEFRQLMRSESSLDAVTEEVKVEQPGLPEAVEVKEENI